MVQKTLNIKVLAIIISVLSLAFISGCDNKFKSASKKPVRENIRGFTVDDTAQTFQDAGNWFVLDPEKDQVEGVSSERAIQDFKLKHQKEIIVAVLDSGVDTKHEDLQGKIWINPGETGLDSEGRDKATNGIDDDNNGYIDDVHGWNFLGNSKGENVKEDTLEVTREMVRFEARLAKGEILTPAEQSYFKKVQDYYAKEQKEAEEQTAVLVPALAKSKEAQALIKEKTGLDDFTQEKLEKLDTKDKDVLEARESLLELIKTYRSLARLERLHDFYNKLLAVYLNKTLNTRTLVGDDPDDFSQTQYGNNDVRGPNADHGTHVAGIIAARRNNGLGINGIAENVKIMALRVVPDGDERDKDIVLAVRYAVDNGAHIINMSFGKSFSPHKAQVDEAFLYAAQKGVIIVHSAGNDAKNNDEQPSFPNKNVLFAGQNNRPRRISTWIEVGASTQKKGLRIVANFSNYGRNDVDIFAPGFQMNSTIPDNQYAVFSGTSMASPTVSGVLALLKSNFPEMTGPQAREFLLYRSRAYPDLEVVKPGSSKFDLTVMFKKLSRTAAIADAYSTVKLATELN